MDHTGAKATVIAQGIMPVIDTSSKMPMATSRRIGYARVSTKDQNLAIQRAALEHADCDAIFEDQRHIRREGIAPRTR